MEYWKKDFFGLFYYLCFPLIYVSNPEKKGQSKKKRIRKTKNLSTDADSRTHTPGLTAVLKGKGAQWQEIARFARLYATY